MNRLICRVCNQNLAASARLVGVDTAKRWHDVSHRLQVSEVASVVVELARKATVLLPAVSGDALRQALLEFDQHSATLGRGYLEYDHGPALWCRDNSCERTECHRCFPVRGCSNHESCRCLR